MTIQKLSRKAIKQGLDQVPFADIMGPQVSKALTPKQKNFAMNLAKGDKGAEAYRKAYNSKGKPHTQAEAAYKLRNRPDIARMQEAYQLAIEGQKYQTPEALRALVIESLVGVIIDPEANHSQVVAAAKVLGTVTEVSAFTERSERRLITSSEDARAKVMGELKRLMLSDATDATVLDNQADSLLAELAAHPVATPQTVEDADPGYEHTIPLERTQKVSTLDPTIAVTEDPPGDDFFDLA